MKPRHPLAVLFNYTDAKGRIVFLGRGCPITISEYTDEMLSVLRHCNGRGTLEEVRKAVPKISDEVFEAIIEVCMSEGIMADSEEVYRQFHLDSSNPLMFPPDQNPAKVQKLVDRPRPAPKGKVVGQFDPGKISAVGKTALLRKSSRAFSDKSVGAAELVQFLGSIYYTGHDARPTPSAGKLYPLRIYAAASDPNQELSGKVYEYDSFRCELVETELEVYPDLVARAVDHPHSPPGIVIFIAADLNIAADKYANRGYRYCLIEAGHIAQNAALVASETGMALLEYGGFDDRASSRLVGLDYPDQAVLLTLILGYPEPDLAKTQFTGQERALAYRLKDAYEGPGKPIEMSTTVPFSTDDIVLPKIRAIASFRSQKTAKGEKLLKQLLHQSTGVSTSMSEAYVKALAESYERYASGVTRYDLIASMHELHHQGITTADPRIYVPFRDSQYVDILKGLKPFDPAEPIQWLMGRKLLSGEPVCVPVEMVFYPIDFDKLGRKPCYVANSSGVAAHTDYDTAVDKALMELIERDAISVLWYSKRKVYSCPDSVSVNTKARIKDWGRLGWSVKILDITLDTLPVCLAIIYSENKYPHFAAGAAAGGTFLEASDKAMDEAETITDSWRKMKNRPVEPEKVRSVIDHARLYFRKESLEYVDWLINAETHSAPKEGTSLAEAKALLDPVVLNLAVASENSPLSVVRVIAEKLLPINFGYGTEHIDHARLRMLDLHYRQSYPSRPIFFA